VFQSGHDGREPIVVLGEESCIGALQEQDSLFMRRFVSRLQYLRRIVRLGFRGVICAIRARVLGPSTLLKVTRADARFPFYLRVATSDVAAHEDIFVNGQYDFATAATPDVIVDAGANIGLASIWFANRFPHARILAIEPEQSNFELLRQNTAPYDSITPVQAAIWGENRELTVVDPGSNKWGFMTRGDGDAQPLPAEPCHRVRGVTVEQIMAEHDIEFIDILKMDIEGAEREVFQDASRWIDKVGTLIVELHERKKSGCNRSFYRATNGFDDEWSRGQNVYLTRSNGCVRRRSA
jgi:FkbM family methyltransferase